MFSFSPLLADTRLSSYFRDPSIARSVRHPSSPGIEIGPFPSVPDFLRALIQILQQTNPGLRVYESPRKITIAGAEALSTMLQGTSPLKQGDQPVPERDWLVTVARPGGGLLHLVFIAPEKQFAQLQPTYQKMLDGLRVR